MGWTESLDLYCERVGPEFWAEPLNAITNIAFILVGFWAWRQSRKVHCDIFVQMFCLSLVVIGVGSFLFHTLANVWSEKADIIPTQLFIFAYTFFALKRFVGLSTGLSMVWFAGIFLSLPYLLLQLPISWFEATNGSLYYLPAFIILFGLGITLLVQQKPSGSMLIAAGLIFVVSLFFRSIDHGVCGSFPLGTHFLMACIQCFVAWGSGYGGRSTRAA